MEELQKQFLEDKKRYNKSNQLLKRKENMIPKKDQKYIVHTY